MQSFTRFIEKLLPKPLQNMKMWLPLQPAKKGNAMLLLAGEKKVEIKFASLEIISTFATRKTSNETLLKQRKKTLK
ncbi:MAG: hypothetical protein ACHQF4_05770 [Sphingobacteriales bacterium]